MAAAQVGIVSDRRIERRTHRLGTGALTPYRAIKGLDGDPQSGARKRPLRARLEHLRRRPRDDTSHKIKKPRLARVGPTALVEAGRVAAVGQQGQLST
jgi:hypothetical protein